MPTSQTGTLAEILSGGDLPLKGEAIPPGQLAYFRERLKGRIFSFIVNRLKKQQQEDPSITQAAIARRLGRRPEQINRWLSGPSNLTAESISDLVLAVCGEELSLEGLGLTAPKLSVAEQHNLSSGAFLREALGTDDSSQKTSFVISNHIMKNVDTFSEATSPQQYYIYSYTTTYSSMVKYFFSGTDVKLLGHPGISELNRQIEPIKESNRHLWQSITIEIPPTQSSQPGTSRAYSEMNTFFVETLEERAGNFQHSFARYTKTNKNSTLMIPPMNDNQAIDMIKSDMQ